MKTSVIFVGIEVIHTILDPSRNEESLIVRRHDALTLALGKVTGTVGSGLIECLARAHPEAEKVGGKQLALPAGQGRQASHVLVARGLLLATPALLALAAPAIARAALAVVEKSTYLKAGRRNALSAPPPRLPPSKQAVDEPSG